LGGKTLDTAASPLDQASWLFCSHKAHLAVVFQTRNDDPFAGSIFRFNEDVDHVGASGNFPGL
jgi:hypothetical protein